MMNIYQIIHELEEFEQNASEINGIAVDNVFEKPYDSIESIDEFTMQWILNDLNEAKEKTEQLQTKISKLQNILLDYKENGLDPVPALPEPARHLWSVCSITQEIYCHRNGLSRNKSSEQIRKENPNEQLLPVFDAATEGQRLASEFVHVRIDKNEFENKWKQNIIDSVYNTITTYESDKMLDCVEWLIEAFLEEENRNTVVLGDINNE